LAVFPDQEERLCDALVNLGWLENDHALHAEAVIAIGNILGCSTDDAKEIAVLACAANLNTPSSEMC
jgi:hypothetical protein